MSSTEWGQVTTACAIGRGVRDSEELPPHGDESTPLRCHPELDRRQQRVSEPGVAPRIRERRIEPEVVEHRRAAGREQADDGVDVVLRVVRVDEERSNGASAAATPPGPTRP